MPQKKLKLDQILYLDRMEEFTKLNNIERDSNQKMYKAESSTYIDRDIFLMCFSFYLAIHLMYKLSTFMDIMLLWYFHGYNVDPFLIFF